jgi:ligand-binding sensor domain-containing protein
VWALYEDREGDIWIGSNSSLTRLRDDLFTTYGKPEGLPNDQPFVVRQDKSGKIWLGYHDSGVALFGGQKSYKTLDGVSDKEIFNIREGPEHEVLLCTRRGLDILRDGRLSHLSLPTPEAPATLDAMVDRHGTVWAVNSAGTFRFSGGRWRNIAEGAAIGLIETPDGTVWSALVHEGLWRIEPQKTLFTARGGLGSNEVRALYAEPDGTLWIGTFVGGLNRFKNGVFRSFTAHDGLLSDNISHIEEDGTAISG